MYQSSSDGYVTVSMLNQFRRQLEESFRMEVNAQVEHVRNGLDEKCNAILVKIPILENRSEEVARLKRELEVERTRRKDNEQGFLESVDKLLEEIVELGVKVIGLDGRIAKVEKMKESNIQSTSQLPRESEKVSTAAVASSKVSQPETEVVEMITDLSKDIQAKFLEIAESQSSFHSDIQTTKKDFDKKLVDMISHVNKTLGTMEDRIRVVERMKQPNLPSSTTDGGESQETLVGMITDLSKDIQAKFLEFEESQTSLRMIIENCMREDEPPGSNLDIMESPLEATPEPSGSPMSLPMPPPLIASNSLNEGLFARVNPISHGTGSFHSSMMSSPSTQVMSQQSSTPPSSSSGPNFDSLTLAHLEDILGGGRVPLIQSRQGTTPFSTHPPTTSSSPYPPPQHGRLPQNPFNCLCGREFKSSTGLSHHIGFHKRAARAAYPPKPPHEVPIGYTCCGKRFTRMIELQQHRHISHPNRVPIPTTEDYIGIRLDHGLLEGEQGGG